MIDIRATPPFDRRRWLALIGIALVAGARHWFRVMGKIDEMPSE